MRPPATADAIPLVDLRAQYRALKTEMDAAIIAAVEGGAFVLGPAVERFEADFARYLGVKHFVCCQSGTSAITLMLKAGGLRPGDEVITTPLTFFATVEGIVEAGGVPVFADVDPATLNLSPRAVEAALTKRTRAVLPVHLYGQPADMDALSRLCAGKGLMLFEDAAQAAGSRLHGKRAGSLGKAASFSFYPGKNLGAYGEAGGVATSDDETAAALKRLRNHGSDRKNFHLVMSSNERLETIQGAVLGVKLPHLDEWNAARRRHAAAYRAALSGAKGLSFVAEATGAESNYHLFVVRHARRDALLASLLEQRILADIHYPVCCHLQPALGAGMGKAGQLPVAEKAVSEILSLPLFPELSAAQLDRIASAVRAFTGA
jgi:dTDP-4-amino-4,6-dideoxygalactose transaminase